MIKIGHWPVAPRIQRNSCFTGVYALACVCVKEGTRCFRVVESLWRGSLLSAYSLFVVSGDHMAAERLTEKG